MKFRAIKVKRLRGDGAISIDSYGTILPYSNSGNRRILEREFGKMFLIEEDLYDGPNAKEAKKAINNKGLELRLIPELLLAE